jgi:hypothetical protein
MLHYSPKRSILLYLPGWQATHNPLVPGSSPGGPITHSPNSLSVQLRYSARLGALYRRLGGEPCSDRVRYLESPHPEYRMAIHRQDLSNQKGRRRVAAPGLKTRWAEVGTSSERGSTASLYNCLTVEDPLGRYLAEITPTKRPCSQTTDRQRSVILIRHLGRYSLAAVTAEVDAKFRDARLAVKRNLAPRTCTDVSAPSCCWRDDPPGAAGLHR